jgi:hypothetical protein
LRPTLADPGPFCSSWVMNYSSFFEAGSRSLAEGPNSRSIRNRSERRASVF